MADIKENTFLGSAAMPQPDGTPEGAGGAHLPRGDARHRRRASAVHHPRQHHDQRHGGRRDGDGRRRRGHQGQIQGRREDDRRPAERADRALRDRRRRRPQGRRGIHRSRPRPRSRTARWRPPASTSAATARCRSSDRLGYEAVARGAPPPAYFRQPMQVSSSAQEAGGRPSSCLHNRWNLQRNSAALCPVWIGTPIAKSSMPRRAFDAAATMGACRCLRSTILSIRSAD